MPRNDELRFDPDGGAPDTARLTDRSRGILLLAMEEAALRAAEYVDPEHVLLAMAMTEGVAGHILRRVGATPRAIEGVMARVRCDRLVDRESPPWSKEAMRCIARAHDERTPLGHDYVGTEHLILGVVLSGEGRIPEILTHLKLVAGDIQDAVYDLFGRKP
jgi:ATP-dependent Clp protease ATP-binding subunit ClpC